MSERSKNRVQRIRRVVPLDVVLENYGYAVRSGVDREQQFSCDLHGDGQDSSPSARYYPDSFSWHCFACGRSRDSVTTIMEKEGLVFYRALDAIERRFKLPPLPWEKIETPVVDTGPDIEAALNRIRKLLQNFTDDQDLPLDEILALWEAFDFAAFGYRKHTLNDGTLLKALDHIHRRVMEKLCQQG